jgi:hypothetical protein
VRAEAACRPSMGAFMSAALLEMCGNFYPAQATWMQPSYVKELHGSTLYPLWARNQHAANHSSGQGGEQSVPRAAGYCMLASVHCMLLHPLLSCTA